ncbi:cutinase family protein [Nocardia sp. XZ_19_385]|uniref:cutinase family protein n=1 Tax=Nocardia sp. XZ_19_385 TaxID=2769488 RepID=UPI001E4D1556|nr:cutinase family protein [Nocardia sp. XZ_19_385]
MTTHQNRRVRPALSALMLGAATTFATTMTAGPSQAVPIGPGCPGLYVLGIQGTGQSSPTADPLADTGVVGALLGPVVAAVPGLVQRSYLGYGAGFGGIVPGGGPDPYVASVTDARVQLDAAARQITEQCPNTLLAGVAYSQGAHAMSAFARDVGSGNGPVGPEKIAAIALYSNPTRSPDSPIFPGRPGQTVPDPAPGTAGGVVSGVQLVNAPAAGSGLDSSAAGYGELEGRVADICVDGDLACSAPSQASVLRIGAQLFAQANLNDPISALASVNGLFHAALGEAWATVISSDFTVGGGNVDYTPSQSLLTRMIEAADPRIPAPTPQDADLARARWGEITAIVAANPVALVPKLAGQLGAAWGQLVADNASLSDPGVWLHFANTVAAHNGYALSGQLGSGIAWLTALAHDIGPRP